MNSRQFQWTVGLAAVLLVAVAYGNTLRNEFVWDDASSILLHEHVQNPSSILQLFQEDLHPFGRGQGNFYRPLLAVSFMVDYALSGPAEGDDPSPVLFHLSNAAWHIAACLLLFALLARMGAPRFVQAAATLIFAVHPLNTEAVTYISGRADPMATAWMLAAVLSGLHAAQGRRPALATGLCGVFTAAALLTKESAVLLPFLLALTAGFFGSTRSEEERTGLLQALKNAAAPLIVATAATAVYAALRLTVLSFGSDSAPRELSFVERMTEVFQALALYVKLFFAPTSLHMERTLTDEPLWLAYLGAALLLAFLALLIWSLRSRRIVIAWGVGWFLLNWLPVSGVFPLNAPMAEHWMYLPLMGFLAVLFGLVHMAWNIQPIRYGAWALVYGATVVFCGLTAQRNLDWRTNESIFLATLRHNPASIRVQYNLAVTYQDLLGNLPAARRHYARVLELYQDRKAQQEEGREVFWEDELEAHLSLGRIYLAQDSPQRAAPHFARILSLEGDGRYRGLIQEAALGMAEVYMQAGNVAEAQAMVDRARELGMAPAEAAAAPS